MLYSEFDMEIYSLSNVLRIKYFQAIMTEVKQLFSFNGEGVKIIAGHYSQGQRVV